MSVVCPKCQEAAVVKSGIVKERQRYKCKTCAYFFTVNKEGKQTDPYYVVKALQLYLEGVSLREIERILGVSHVSVANWVKKYHIEKPQSTAYHPTYQVLTHEELMAYCSDKKQLKGSGCMITELGDKFMVIQWVRFRKSVF
ncbi:MAG: transposase-like zinc-binding domain-containing protein [Saprospiraceae bacterium]|jgi:transposase-like protein